jgi:hypothetical protein
MPHISQLTKIEILCEKRFHEEFGNGTLWGEYLVARGKMFTEILPYIRAKEPWLTDHDGTHIENVWTTPISCLENQDAQGRIARNH